MSLIYIKDVIKEFQSDAIYDLIETYLSYRLSFTKWMTSAKTYQVYCLYYLVMSREIYNSWVIWGKMSLLMMWLEERKQVIEKPVTPSNNWSQAEIEQ